MTDESAQTPDKAPPAADPQSIEGLFLQALGQSAERREAFLDEACGDDAQRRMRIEALLRAYEDAGSFLEKPPVGMPADATLSLEFLAPSDDPGLLGTLGPYEVYEMLGRGGMGIVFRARDPKLNRVVAIKVLAPELAANPNARRRFLREAQAAAAISHPHVVTIHAVDEGAESRERRAESHSPSTLNPPLSTLPYIVMECIVGQTLQQKLDKQGSLRLTEILRIGHQTAQGLSAAHKQGLIHRDIKPANILLENGIERVKITDFGLARAADDVSITRTGEVSGTPQYMSPEQASGGTIDHRSDLFSLGCVLYAMCTGRSPFRATTLAAAIRRVCDDTPRPIEEINPEVPHWLIAIVNKLLAKDPDERYQSTQEVEHLLGEHLAEIQQPYSRRSSLREPHEPVPQRGARPFRQEAAAIPTPELAASPKVPTRVRAAIWAGTLTLLLPLFVLLVGSALRADGRAPENAVIAAIVCVPIAVALLAIALSDRCWRNSDVANGLFLLLCILMGPIGILVYLYRQDQWAKAAEEPQPSAPQQLAQVPPTGTSGDHEDPVVPQWLLTPLPRPMVLFSLLLGGIAALVMGQAIEQWSDVDSAAGTFLSINATLLGLLAWRIAVAAGPPFDGSKWLLISVGAIVLMYLGAQSPDREFKQELARVVQGSTAIAWITGGVALVVAWLWYCLHSAPRDPGDGSSTGERFGRGLVIGALVIWGLLGAWSLSVANGWVNPPPFDQRFAVDEVVMGIVMVGGVLFAIGMILARRVITPGLVHRVQTDLDSRQPSSGDAAGLAHKSEGPPPSATGRSRGWRSPLGTLVGLLLFLMTCFVVMLIMPTLTRRTSDRPNGQRTEVPEPAVIVPDPNGIQRDEDGFPPMRVIPLGGEPGTIQIQTTGDIDIGRVTIDDEDVPLQRTQEGHLQFPADTGHHNLMVTTQSGERFHIGVDVDDKRGAVVQVPPRGDGILQVDFADPLLGFSLLPKPGGGGTPAALVKVSSVSNGGAFSFIHEDGRYRVPSGTYDVWVTDNLAGWCREGTRQPLLFSSQQIDVAPGRSRSLTIRRTLKPLVPMYGGWSGFRLYDFRWNAKVQTFTRPQAQVVERLFAAYADGEPDVEAKELLTNIDADPFSAVYDAESTPPESLEALFDDGQHPAWGTMIVAGKQEGSYRLAELHTSKSEQSPDEPQPEMATLQLDFEDAGLHLFLHTGDKDHARRIGPIDESRKIAVEPGKYTASIEDDLAGWYAKDKYGEPGPVQYEYDRLELNADQQRELNVTRNFYKMAAAIPRGLVTGTHRFRWQGESYTLDSKQAPIVAVLLKRYAEEEPEVHEGQLLTGATFTSREVTPVPMTSDEAAKLLKKYRDDGHSLKGLFDAGEHPAWGTMIVPGKEPDTYRLAKLQETDVEKPAEPAEQSAATPAGSHPQPVVVGSLTPGPRERAGQLLVIVQDDGLLIAVRRKSAFDGSLSASEQQVTTVGYTGLRLHPGEYVVLRRDQWFGLTQGTTQRVNVNETDFRELTFKRDLKAEADRVVQEATRALKANSPQETFEIAWDGQSQQYIAGQALVVGLLMQACVGDSPSVSGEDLLKPWKAVRPQAGDSLEKLFNNGEHPAWGTIIIAGDDGTYELKHVPQGRLVVTGDDPRLSAEITPAQKNPRFTKRSVAAGMELQLPPGTYNVQVRDDGVGWVSQGDLFPAAFGSTTGPTRTVEVADGGGVDLKLNRDWNNYVEPIIYFQGTADYYQFRWFPDRQTFITTGGSGGTSLNTRQARIVSRLLKGLAENTPDVAETDLIEALGELGKADAAGNTFESLSDVFEGLGEGKWKDLIVPGKTEGTWRLKVPRAKEDK